MVERSDISPVKSKVSEEISQYMATLGRRGGKVGGKRRLETLTQDQRSEIAFRAAKARWNNAKKP
jgi:hypothetical protein